MGLDKKFLKYKLEKIKNDRIFKEQDSETKKRIRKENSKLAQEEADAIHSYLTGEDPIDALDNKSFLENRLPGSLFLIPRRKKVGNKKWENQGELNIRRNQSDPTTKKNRLLKVLKKFKTVAKSNANYGKEILKLGRIFDRLRVTFGSEGIKVDGNINMKSMDVQGDINLGGKLNFVDTPGQQGPPPQSLTPNGYVELPGGMIMQWGTGTSSSDDEQNFEFSLEFPNACFNVVTQRITGDARDVLPVQNITTTNFEINRNSVIDGSHDFYWQAIGN